MARKPRAYVLDSWALLGYLEDEQSASVVGEVIGAAQTSKQGLYLTAVTAGEVWSILAKEWSATEADRAIAELQHLGLQLVDVTWALAAKAAELRTKSKMPWLECLNVALAIERKAELLSGDRELRQFDAIVRLRLI
jgi:predicted nucleic acid-binding protein